MGSKVRFIKTFPCGMTGWLGRCKDSQRSYNVEKGKRSTSASFIHNDRLVSLSFSSTRGFYYQIEMFFSHQRKKHWRQFFSFICYCLNLRLCKDSFQFNKGSCDIWIFVELYLLKWTSPNPVHANVCNCYWNM